MKISCTQENLNQGLFVVSHIASKNTALPILNNVLIQAKENSIKFSATNLEIGVSCVIRGKIEQNGEFTVQSRLLADYVSLLPKEKVDLEVLKNQEQNEVLKVACKNNSTKVKGQSATDFPLIPQIEKTKSFTVGSKSLRQAISQVVFAVSVSETRPEINGVLFNFNDNMLIMAATDSYRLAEKKIKLKKSSTIDQKVIVPTRTLQEILRILGSFKDPAAISEVEEVEIYLSENQIMFSFGSIELISRLIEGQYPDYQQIIPSQSNTKTVVGVSEIINATKTTSLFARSGIYDVSLEFLSDQKQTVISSANSQLGENVSKLSSDISGDSNNIVVNYRYLLDGLQNIETAEVEVGVIDSSSPCVLKPVAKEVDYLYIIMPIRQ
ncbi:MAG: DNA polymerase III subunit beta [Patescibacteria group bacterium]|jgi:DNA polymerase-3 subunit beta|nr:DNA polymerase III subunit beta [Patescibacteria group bacterium]